MRHEAVVVGDIGQGYKSKRLSLADIKLADLIFLLGFNALFFESFFQVSISHALSFIDEFCAAVLFFIAIKDYLLFKSQSIDGCKVGRIVFVTVLFLSVGAFGTIVYKLQTGLYPVFIDAFTSGKGLLCLASALYLARTRADKADDFVRMVVAECKLLTLVCFTAVLLNLVADVGFGGEGNSRYGLRPFAFIFYHPTIVVYLVTGMAAVLFAHETRPAKWCVLLCVILVATLRSKGFGEAAVIVLVLLVLCVKGEKAKLRWWHMAIAAAALLIVGWSQLEYYYLSSTSSDQARTILTQTSIELANSHFPIGTGFATYGSAITVDSQFYSILYYKYGFNLVWGLSPEQPGFITDSFWPTVTGQFGYFGLLSMVLVIVFICIDGYRYANSCGPKVLGSFLIIIAYLLLSSTSESAFFAPQCVYLAVCLCISLLGNAGGAGKLKAQINVSLS